MGTGLLTDTSIYIFIRVLLNWQDVSFDVDGEEHPFLVELCRIMTYLKKTVVRATDKTYAVSVL